jgi:hypothetical protein
MLPALLPNKDNSSIPLLRPGVSIIKRLCALGNPHPLKREAGSSRFEHIGLWQRVIPAEKLIAPKWAGAKCVKSM